MTRKPVRIKKIQRQVIRIEKIVKKDFYFEKETKKILSKLTGRTFRI